MTFAPVNITELCEIVAGATPDTGESRFWGGDVCWATPKDLSDLDGSRIADTPRKLTKAGLDACSATLLPPGSVLFSSRAPIGLVAINNVPMATNQGFKSFVPKPGKIHSGYLYYWLRANRPRLESMGNGATFKEVSKGVVERIQIPVPFPDDSRRSFTEQKRIAAILNKADALRRKRHHGVETFNRLAMSEFFNCFNRNALKKTKPLSELGVDFRYGTSNKSGEMGYPALRIPNVIGGTIDLTDLKTVQVEPAELDRLRLLEGDILFVRTNGNPDYVGRSAVFLHSLVHDSGFDEANFIYASYLIRARVNRDSLEPIFLHYYLQTPTGRHALHEHCKTSAGQYNINTEGLGALPVPVIDIRQQQSFARMIDRIDSMRRPICDAARGADDLFNSLVQRAFRGAL